MSLADTPITAEHFTLVIGDETVVFDVDNACNFVGCRRVDTKTSEYIVNIIQSLESCAGKKLNDVLCIGKYLFDNNPS